MENITLILLCLVGALVGHLLVRFLVEPGVSQRSMALRADMYEYKASELDKRVDKLEKRIDNFPSL